MADIFGMTIPANFQVGPYTFNADVPTFSYKNLTVAGDNTPLTTHFGLVQDNVVTVVTFKSLLPTKADELLSDQFDKKHSWRLKSGHYEAYYDIPDMDIDHSVDPASLFLFDAVRYVWDPSRKMGSLQGMQKRGSYYLPVSELFDCPGDFDEINDFLSKAECLLTVPDNALAICEETFKVANNDSFKTEIQRALLESPSSLDAIAKLISHSHIPISYKLQLNKAYVNAVRNNAVVSEH